MSSRRDFLMRTATAGILAGVSLRSGYAIGESHATTSPGTLSTASKRSTRIKSVLRREETVLRYAHHGDNWHMSWAGDDRQLVSLCDGTGPSEIERERVVFYNSRLLAITGGPDTAKFADVPGYPMLGAPPQTQNDPRYYNFGTLALDGRIYQFLSTFNRAFSPLELWKLGPGETIRFNGVKLIFSPDNGRTWCNQDGTTPVVWEEWNKRSKERLVFFEEDQDAFSLLSVLQMGKNYEHNTDGYVYVYAPNGSTDGTMNELVMFRTPKNRILERTAYEYFAGLQPNGDAYWSKDINARKPVHEFPRGWVNAIVHPFAWQPSITYNAPLGLYMMANWGMGAGPAEIIPFSGDKVSNAWFAKPSYLGFWTAETPWGRIRFSVFEAGCTNLRD